MKNILIIGAGRGIGLRSAELLKNENLFTISRNLTPELEALDTNFFQADITTDDLSELQLPEELHGLIYCPGSINLKPFSRFTEADFLADFHQNFLGAVKIIQKCLIIKRKVRIFASPNRKVKLLKYIRYEKRNSPRKLSHRGI